MSTTRRRFTAGIATAAALATPSVVSATTDPHREWLERKRSIDEGMERISGAISDDELYVRVDASFRLMSLIWQTEAKTIDGLRVQIELLLEEEVTQWGADLELDGYRNMLATLDQLREDAPPVAA